MARKIEVEGKEAAIMNQFGDIAIIPINKVAGIKSMLERGCDTCIDRIVNRLPSVGNVAEDGMTLPNISFSEVESDIVEQLQSMGFDEDEILELLDDQDKDIFSELEGTLEENMPKDKEDTYFERSPINIPAFLKQVAPIFFLEKGFKMEEGGFVEGTAEPQRSSRPGNMLNLEPVEESEELAELRRKYEQNEEEKNKILNEIMFLPEITDDSFGTIINAQTNVLLDRLKKLNEENLKIESQYYDPERNPILDFIRYGDGEWQREGTGEVEEMEEGGPVGETGPLSLDDIWDAVGKAGVKDVYKYIQAARTPEDGFPSQRWLREKLYMTIPPSAYPEEQIGNVAKNFASGATRMKSLTELDDLYKKGEYKKFQDHKDKILELISDLSTTSDTNKEQKLEKELSALSRANDSPWGKITDGFGVMDEDLWRTYLGIPQIANTVVPSKYKPTKAKDSNVKYYTLSPQDSDEQESIMENLFWNLPVMMPGTYEQFMTSINNPTVISNEHLPNFSGLQSFTVDKGKDARGEYISMYDKYDFDLPFDNPVGKPFEIYDRIYIKKYNGKYRPMHFTNKEFASLNPADKKLDLVKIAKELENRGVVIKPSKDFGKRGTKWAEEVLSNLRKYQKNNKSIAPNRHHPNR